MAVYWRNLCLCLCMRLCFTASSGICDACKPIGLYVFTPVLPNQLKFSKMERIHTHGYFLTAAECNAQQIMPLSLLVERIIETATEHANKLHIGYADLAEYHIGWVLSRLSIEVDRWPAMNTDYALRTWITDVIRLWSTRSHELLDADGDVIGRVRTVWVAIDTEKRTAADLSVLDPEAFVCPGRECPLPPMRRLSPVGEADRNFEYEFRVSDIDVNRHVTSRRYVDLVVDANTLGWYDTHCVRGFDIAFQHECLFGQKVSVAVKEIRTDDSCPETDVEIIHEGTRMVSARLKF